MPSHIVEQEWSKRYGEVEHSAWETLLKSTRELSTQKACSLYKSGSERINFDTKQIPDFFELSERLTRLNGWEIIAVTGYLPDEIFFKYISDKKFPASCEIRSLDESTFQEYPDLFHDIYGHVPLLVYPEITDLLQCCARAILEALKIGRPDLAKKIASVYWFTIEVGLIRESGEIRVYGAAIASSRKETIFATQDMAPNLIQFNLERVMRTEFNMLDLQESYFVIENFEELKRIAKKDLFKIALNTEHLPILTKGQIYEGDGIIQLGTGSYHRK